MTAYLLSVGLITSILLITVASVRAMVLLEEIRDELKKMNRGSK